MKIRVARLYLSLCIAASAVAQQSTPVPRVTYFSGAVKDATGAPGTGTVGITFSLYEEPQGGAPLWTEIQNVPLDDQGRYTVLLGSMQPEGLPQDLFSSGKARWLGVTPQLPDAAEQPRILLVGVPYALKAADADTLGGLPASAFLQAAASTPAARTQPGGDSGFSSDTASAGSPDAACTKIASDGTALANQVAKFTAACKIEPSAISESGGKVGIGTTTPAATLSVNGATTLGGTATLPATGTATATAGASSEGLDLLAASFDSTTSTSISEHFRWQAEAAGNDTASPSGTVNLLYAQGSGTPTETGLSINSLGLFTFAPAQVFPGTGKGTITGVTAGADLTGGGTSGAVTLALDTTKVPLLAAPNSFTGNQTANGQWISTVSTGTAPLVVSSTTRVANLNASLLNGIPSSAFAGNGGNVFNGTQQINSGNLDLPQTVNAGTGMIRVSTVPFLHACCSQAAENTFVGNSGNFATTGNANTAAGYNTLNAVTTGSNNTAVGFAAGVTATAANANTTGSNNTFVGSNAGPGTATQLSNATAIGANAVVSASNALVLGASGVSVGLGTTAPAAILDVEGPTPPIVQSGNGTNATPVLQVVGGNGGTTNNFGGVGGNGASVTITAGSGGHGPPFGDGGQGGNVTITPGAAGAAGYISYDGIPGSILFALHPDYGFNANPFSSNLGGNVVVDSNGVSAGVVSGLVLGGAVIFGSSSSGEGISSTRQSGYPNQYGLDLFTDYNARVSITQGGSVGIGTQTPAATLDVNGAAHVSGNLNVSGTLTKGGGSFKIDHPLDPANKYLSHSFVESPDMMNIYNGNAVLDARGEAVIQLPDWFEALNRDFRYQLTCIGGFAPVYIASKISGGQFRIGGGKPGLEVSWQVTGIRQDAYANAHRIPVEEEKPAAERGHYLHPDAFGQVNAGAQDRK